MASCSFDTLADNAPEKLNRDLDNLTPLSPRNSLLMDPYTSKDGGKRPSVCAYPLDRRSSETFRPYTNNSPATNKNWRKHCVTESSENLVGAAVSMGVGHRHDRNISRESYRLSRQPTVPNVSLTGRGY